MEEKNNFLETQDAGNQEEEQNEDINVFARFTKEGFKY